MHEMSICRAIADTVVKHAAGRSVSVVRVRIGHFRQVVPDTLTFCWGLLSRDTGLSDARLEVESVPATVRCADCGATTELDLPVLICGTCASRRVELISGEEFVIESIDVREEAC